MKGHTAEITAISHENGKLITGGKDSKIIIFKAAGGEYAQEKVIDLESSYPKALDYFNGKILAGLRNGNIHEIIESSSESKLLLASHFEGETWGLEVIPETNSLFTIGDDNRIMEFNYD